MLLLYIQIIINTLVHSALALCLTASTTVVLYVMIQSGRRILNEVDMTCTPSLFPAGAGGAVSFKNLLQEYTHKSKLSLPHYETERTEEGFKSTVSIYTSGKSMTFTSAAYPVKKAAEQEAAKIACTELNLLAP